MKLDWRAYFKEFCRTHSPDSKYVLYGADKETGKGGKWLFADGWGWVPHRADQYSEIPPPPDPEHHLALIKKYWSIRVEVAEHELTKAKQLVLDTMRLQQKHSVSLQVTETQTLEDDDGNALLNQLGQPRRMAVARSVDFNHLVAMVKQHQDESSYCRKRLASVRLPDEEQTLFNPAEILAQLNQIESSKEFVA